MLWYGKEGIPELALANFQRASYLRDQLKKAGIEVWEGPIFNEFVAKFKKPVMEKFRGQGIEPGIELGRFFPELKNHLLIAVTEVKSKEQLDRFAAVAKELA